VLTVRARLTHIAVPLALASLAVLAVGSGPASARSTPRATTHKVQAADASPGCQDFQEPNLIDADIDGDGLNDVTVGLPGLTISAPPFVTPTPPSVTAEGGVQVDLTRSGTQLLLDGEFPAGGVSPDDHFGAVVSVEDLNGDNCSDLQIGAPGDAHAPGRVVVAFGSPTGMTSAGAQVIMPPTRADGDLFGATLYATRQIWTDPTGASSLWVGAPGTTVDGVPDAGAIYHYDVAPDGTATLAQTITEASPIVGLTPAAGDEFGSVISHGPYDSLMIGVPDRAVDGQAQAGIVVNLTSSNLSGVADGAQVLSQDTPGVPGASEAGDHFGASLSHGVVGVPGEDIGTIKDAGAIQVFTAGAGTSGTLVPGPAYDENTAGVPGAAETGDRFGAAVANASVCLEAPRIFVGAPGESIGSISSAGAVTELATTSYSDHCPAAVYHQSGLLPGSAEKGDQVGATLSTVLVLLNDEDDNTTNLLIGVPGEDLGTTVNGGMIQRLEVGKVVDSGYLYGPQRSLQFGATIGQDYHSGNGNL
jgi:hypothetical protein